MIRRITCMLFTLLWVLNSQSQEFGTHWITHPNRNDSSEVLFRHTYTTLQRPLQAFITFASIGHCKVYINERNISREIFYENKTAQGILLHTFDVTRYLRPDSNTIAVWYAPCPQAQVYTPTAINKQLSLEYYGTKPDSTAFYHQADDTWTCSILEGSRISTDSTGHAMEVFDNHSYDHSWKATEQPMKNGEKPMRSGMLKAEHTYTTLPAFPYKGNFLKNVLSPISIYSDSLGTHFEFERTFRGSARITLRGAKKGERLEINGLLYICSGEMDEQAFRRLTTSRQKTITIKGDRYFDKSQIQKVEGLEIY